MRQPPSGCAAKTLRMLSFMKRPMPERCAMSRIAASAASRTRTDCSDSSYLNVPTPDRARVGAHVAAERRRREELAVVRVLDHREDLDVVVEGGERLLLLQPVEGRLARSGRARRRRACGRAVTGRSPAA